MFRRLAILSIHSSPLGRLGTQNIGGMSIYVRELARAMAAQRCQIDIFTHRTATKAQATEIFPNVNLFYVSATIGSKVPDKSTLYDHLNEYVDAIDRLCQDLGAAYSLIHSNYWLSALIGEELKKRWQCPHIVTFHTLGAAKTSTLDSLEEHEQRIDAENRLIRECEGVIAPTRAERDRCLTMHQGTPGTIHIVPCGVDLELFKPQMHSHHGQHNKKAPYPYQLLFVGRFDPMKGLDTLLHSFALLATDLHIQLLLVGGDGPESPAYQHIEQLAKALGVDNKVEFMGPVQHQLMPEYYNAADAVVVPSRYESFGLIILEALACGTPVAAMPVGIAPQVIQAGSNGYLAEHDDSKSLANAISKTLSLAEKSERERIRESVVHLSWSRVAAMLSDVYQNAINMSLVKSREGQYEGRS